MHMNQAEIKVIMVGLGYIGLPTAALMAGKNLKVTGVDVNASIVDTIKQGKIHIIEPDLEGLVHYAVKNNLLQASTKPMPGDVFMIAVPTPFQGDHLPDISFVESATRSVVPFLRAGNLFIIESTSPVGTTEKMADMIFEMRPELKDKIYIAYCPERVLPGRVIYELENNDRVIGGITEEASGKAVQFYQRFVKGQLHVTNARTAEMCKLVENASRDVNIAFANELSLICDKADIDVYELIRLANRHPRVNILNPGPGVGGHCIAVDPWFIVSDFPEQSRLIRTSREINNYKTEWVVEKIKNTSLQFELDHQRKPVIACLGLAFKANIDDLRESPALMVYQKLKADGFDVLAVEPNLSRHPKIPLTGLEDAWEQADITVALVAHTAFQKLPKERIDFNFCGL